MAASPVKVPFFIVVLLGGVTGALVVGLVAGAVVLPVPGAAGAVVAPGAAGPPSGVAPGGAAGPPAGGAEPDGPPWGRPSASGVVAGSAVLPKPALAPTSRTVPAAVLTSAIIARRTGLPPGQNSNGSR